MARKTNYEVDSVKDHIKALRAVVKRLGMQRTLWELASIINRPDAKQNLIRHCRLRYESQFSHDLHHTTADDRNIDSLED